MKRIFYLLLSFIVFACNKKQNEIQTKTKSSLENNKLVKNTDRIDLSVEENKLLQIHNDIVTALGNVRNDTLLALKTQEFTNSFTYLIKNNNYTLTYPFEKLQKENALKTVTSADNKLRVYSWDNNLGGSMRFFNQIFQFKVNGKVKVNEHIATKDSQTFFSKIYTVKNKNNESIYLVISNSVLSSKYSVQHINAYKISGEDLHSAAVFKTKTNTLKNISVEYDFFSVVDRPERPVELITLENNILKIALVEDQQNVTTKNLIYEWNGQHFIYTHIK